MANMEVLNQENFEWFCAKNYDNSHCLSIEEFQGDLLHLKYLKKLVTRYVETGELKERLILNHIIILSNVFDPEVLCKILFLKMSDYMEYIKPFLILLNLLPEKLYNVGKEEVIDTTLISMDPKIVSVLREIRNA